MGGSGGNGAPWWDDAWTNRVRITFQNDGGEVLKGFPVMVRLDDQRLENLTTSATGADLRFIDSDGKTILAHEIEQWMPDGDSFVWVRVPEIDATNADHIWLYYGNQGASNETKPTEVWKGFLGVYHLSPTMFAPSEFPDSTATLNGSWVDYDTSDMTKPPIIPGVIGRAINLDGKRHVHLGDNNNVSAEQNEARTVEAWVRTSVVQEQFIVYEEGGCLGWYLGMAANGGFTGSFITDEAGDTCAGKVEYSVQNLAKQSLQWRYLALVVDRPNEQMSLYVDGVRSTFAMIDNTYRGDGNGLFRIGGDYDGGQATFQGAIDEVRISDGARSAGWIAAQHKSMKDTLLVFSTE